MIVKLILNITNQTQNKAAKKGLIFLDQTFLNQMQGMYVRRFDRLLSQDLLSTPFCNKITHTIPLQ